jgi:hypothetical protein
MIEAFAWLFCIAALLGIAWWLAAPPRSVIWRAVKLWGEDNEEAALVREHRRAARNARSSVTLPATAFIAVQGTSPKRERLFEDAQLDPGMPWGARR